MVKICAVPLTTRARLRSRLWTATVVQVGHDFALSDGGAQIQESKNLYGGSSAPYTPERPY